MASKTPKDPLFTEDFWERPPPSTTGDFNQIDTYAAVGRALSVWEMVEEQLAKICVIFCGTPADGRANSGIRRLYGSIDSSSARRRALKYMAQTYFGDSEDGRQMKNKLNSLCAAVSFAARRRDDIAHGTVAGFTGGKKQIGSFLIPSSYNTERNKAFFRTSEIDPKAEFPWHALPGEYRYNKTDIDAFTAKFEMLLKSTYDHAAEFSAWKTPSWPA